VTFEGLISDIFVVEKYCQKDEVDVASSLSFDRKVMLSIKFSKEASRVDDEDIKELTFYKL
jgi:hypothetical protein